jgi:hypothetical protein
MAWMLLSSKSESTLCLPLSAAVADDGKWQSTPLPRDPGMQGHNMSHGMSRDISQIYHSFLGLQRDYKKPPDG